MKKKLFTIAAMMLCIVMLLSSCSLLSGNIQFKKFIDKDYQPDIDASRTTVEKLDINGKLLYPATGNIIVLQGLNKTTDRATYTVYNLAANKVIWQGENSFAEIAGGDETVSYTLQLKEVSIEDENVCLTIVTKETRTVTSFAKTVYDVTVWAEDGTEVVTCKNVDEEKVEDSIWPAADLFSIQEKVYRVSKDGRVEYAFDWSSARQKPTSYLTKAGEYYVDFSHFEGESSVSIYDNSLNTVATYVPPAYDVLGSDSTLFDLTTHTHILSNGNVIVQYVVGQDIMAKKYDFMLLGGKYNLHTVLLDVKTGKVIAKDIAQGSIWIYNHGSDQAAFVKKQVGTVALETWIKSPDDRTIGAWIDCQGMAGAYSRLQIPQTPRKGEWNCFRASISLNGENVPPPDWKQPGMKSTTPKDREQDIPYSTDLLEKPLVDELFTLRPPTRLKLKKGWNHVRIVLNSGYRWGASFCPVAGTSEHPREVEGLEYSSEPPQK